MTVHTPIETRSGGIPRWALALTAFVFLVGGVYLASNLTGENPPFAMPGVTDAAPGNGDPDPAVGEALVAQAGCAACHGADLGGQAAFPTLLELEEGPISENLEGLAEEHPDEWVALWIDGTTPETEGIDRGGMPAFGNQYTRDQIDAMVAYLRGL
ncbi:MAG TPA: cytochrome c [Candidatus Limnocylindrales bacterium]|jgi:mono/diheme cytochrome c family protein|nr:cytochrome c [Candidatus Limnocylindrales bacterium]